MLKMLGTFKAVLVIFFILSSKQIPAQKIDLADGLTAFYPFSENLLSRTSEAPQIVRKGASWVRNRFGEDSKAMAFDGVDQHLLIPTENLLALSDFEEFSVSLWIKPRDNNSGCIILREGDFGLKWNGLKKPITVFNGLRGGFPNGKKSAWASKEWYHLVLVQSNKFSQLFINGELDMAWEVVDKDLLEASPIYVGKHPYLWGGFTGMVDDLAFYNRALNEYEISVLYQIENIPIESDLDQVRMLEPDSILGTWTGILTQPDNPIASNYAFSLKFTKQSDGVIVGHSRIEIVEEAAFGVSKVQGIVSGNLVNFEETQIVRQKNYMGYKWCKKYGNFSYIPDSKSIRGKWYAENCSETGELLLFRTNSQFNYFDNRLSQHLSLDSLTQLVDNDELEKRLEKTLLTVEIQSLLFSLGSSEIAEESLSYLEEKVVPVFIEFPKLKASIHGHTDNVGNDQRNLELSLNRAKVVRNFLVSRGVRENQLNFVGYGESKPISSNETLEGRKKNRRVEIELSL
ncbi:MAG: OmpA family protein [Bacteroidota bacterium]